ncbi:MAG: hydroxyacylglutathione hydrolase [Gammaproteobacteria bacterium]|nr:hydroxyacylglutathione hydrolase [Gammaproteobacteria bacterium]
MLAVAPIKAFTDNYIWALINNRAKTCAVVDPGDAYPVIEFLEQEQLTLSAILITHHHRDHTGGLLKLRNLFNLKVYGPANHSIKGIDVALVDGESVNLDSIDAKFKVMEVPGHTLDHIAFFGEGSLFCGDTLFAGGCGRLFEGTPQQMLNSLQKLAQLPENTKVYCAHEYTLANLTFAKTVEPDNQALIDRYESVEDLRHKDQITLPSTIQLEITTNPFMRTNKPTIKQAAETFLSTPLSTESDIFAAIRKWKDNF